jgi:hypothetical protein
MMKTIGALITATLVAASVSAWAEKARQPHENLDFKSAAEVLRTDIASQQKNQRQSKRVQAEADKKTAASPILSVLKVNGI